jgi:hypothetical protein
MIQKVDWAPYKWSEEWKTAPALPGIAALNAVTNEYWTHRTIRRSFIGAFASNGDALGLLVSLMAWGFGPDLRGPGKIRRMLTQPRVAGGQTADVVAADVLNKTVNFGARIGFQALFANHNTRAFYLGPSFGSKLVYFAGYAGGSLNPAPAIYDQRVYEAASCQPSWPRISKPQSGSSAAYEHYCCWLQGVARNAGTRSDVVEFALFR